MVGPPEHRVHGALRAQINVTPLVDVVLVLLIIFMVVTPLLTRGKDVQLPAAKTASRNSTVADVVVVTVTSDRQLWLETQAIRDTDLEAELADRAGRGRELLLKADVQLSVGELRPLLRRLRAAGFDQISFGVIEPSRAEGDR